MFPVGSPEGSTCWAGSALLSFFQGASQVGVRKLIRCALQRITVREPNSVIRVSKAHIKKICMYSNREHKNV